jgi:hypothetical protein
VIAISLIFELNKSSDGTMIEIKKLLIFDQKDFITLDAAKQFFCKEYNILQNISNRRYCFLII